MTVKMLKANDPSRVLGFLRLVSCWIKIFKKATIIPSVNMVHTLFCPFVHTVFGKSLIANMRANPPFSMNFKKSYDFESKIMVFMGHVLGSVLEATNLRKNVT